MRIANRKLTLAEFRYYLLMTQVLGLSGIEPIYLPSSIETKDKRNIISNLILDKSLENLALLWKAEKERIKVDDREVAETIKKRLFKDSEFKPQTYLRFLNSLQRELRTYIEPHTYEEYVRNFLKIEKLLKKMIKVELKEEEIKEFYLRQTQKAKIAYIFVPYERFKNELKVTEKEINDFYQKKNSLFKEERKVKVRYIIIDDEKMSMEVLQKEIKNLKNLEEIAKKFNGEIKETDFLSLNDPIAGMGWQEGINRVAFSLKNKEISPPIRIDRGLIFLEKKEEREAHIPPLDAIREKVEETLKEERAKTTAQEFAQKLSEKIQQENITDLKVLAERESLEFKITEYFKYGDYIEGLGMEEEVNRVVFSLEVGKIHPHPFILLKGAYIIQLKELSPFEEKDYQENKEKYAQLLKEYKENLEKSKLIQRITEEANLKVYVY